jgi:hypothetical protein
MGELAGGRLDELATLADKRTAILHNLPASLSGTRRLPVFAYSIVIDAIYGSCEPFQTQDRFMAAPCIPSDVRPQVMPLSISERRQAQTRRIPSPSIGFRRIATCWTDIGR